MIDQLVQTIGWTDSNDRCTKVSMIEIKAAVPKFHEMQEEIADEFRGDIKKFIDRKGILCAQDVLVILRRTLKRSGKYISYERGSTKGLKMKNTPLYLYRII